jgi:hypothetical protein
MELDRYAAQTGEDIYRAFELLDAQRRDLELVRGQDQSRMPEADFSQRVLRNQSERLIAAETGRLPVMRFDK